MKKFIITEEERSRILGMHQSATKKQYLNEDAVTVVPGTISVPYNIDSKTGAQVLATNQYVKVTIINEKTPQNKNGWLTEMGYDSLGQIQFQTPGLSFPLKDIKKDSNGNLTGMFAIVPSQKDLINYLTSMNGKNLPNTNSVSIELKGKGTVKSLPMGVTTKFTTYNPSTPTTTTPTQTKGLNESDIRRIATRVIKESNRGYLMEQVTPAINDVKAALAYFTNLYKTNKYAEGQTFLGRNTFWQVKTPMGQNALRGGDASEIVVRGITSRGGRIWFDVSNDDESLIYGFGRTIQNEPLKLFCNVNCEQWDNSTQSIKPIKAGGTLGGNANLVGGQQNFVKMVMGLPDKSKIGRIPTEMLQKNPNIINNLSPELKQLYQTTATPTQTKGLNESDIRRIATRVIKESNRGYLMETLEGEVIYVTFYIPVITDPKTKEVTMDTRGVVKFTAVNSKGTSGGSLDEYEKINSFAILPANIPNVPVSSMKQNGNIVGSFTLTTNMKSLVNFLWSNKGKTNDISEDVRVDLTTTDKTRVRLYVTPTYKTYEVPTTATPTKQPVSKP